MTGGDDDYGDAFKKAKLEHDERRKGDTETKRLQAEADADTATLSDVVLPQLQAAVQKIEAARWQSRIRQSGRTGKALRPSSVSFRITDQQDLQDQQDHKAYGKGHETRAYSSLRAREQSSSQADTASTKRPASSAHERKQGGRYPAAR